MRPCSLLGLTDPSIPPPTTRHTQADKCLEGECSVDLVDDLILQLRTTIK
jgi:hypothetical protein